MLKIKQYVKAESLEQAYELNQKKTNRIVGGMLWLKMSTAQIQTAIDLSGLGLDQIEETEDAWKVGAAVVWFLIAPAVNQTKSSTKNRNVIALSEQIASQKTQIQTLKDELEGYRNSSDEVESAKQTAASTQDSYDALVKVYQQYYGGTTSNADMADTLLGLNRDSLGEEGQKIYDSISGSVFPRVCVSLYSTAQYEVQSGNYDDAISDLEKIQKMDDSYSDGGVYKLLGDAYAGKGDKDNAKSNYEKAATDYPGTQAAYSAQSALDAMGSDGTSENTSGGTGTQGQ